MWGKYILSNRLTKQSEDATNTMPLGNLYSGSMLPISTKDTHLQSPLLKKKTVCSCKGKVAAKHSCFMWRKRCSKHSYVKEKLAVEERPKRSKDGNGMYCSTTHSELGVAATSLWSWGREGVDLLFGFHTSTSRCQNIIHSLKWWLKIL